MPSASKILAIGVIGCGLLAGGISTRLIAATSIDGTVVSTVGPAATATSDSAAPGITNRSARVAAQTGYVLLSPHLAEILRMVKARLDPEVVKSYIRSSSAVFSPTAADIVLLKRLQVPEELIALMLEHDGELRNRVEQSRRTVSARSSGASPMIPYTASGPFSYPARPNYVYRNAPYYPTPLYFGPLTSFNNSYPTYINGQAVYTGYYVPAYVF